MGLYRKKSHTSWVHSLEVCILLCLFTLMVPLLYSGLHALHVYSLALGMSSSCLEYNTWNPFFSEWDTVLRCPYLRGCLPIETTCIMVNRIDVLKSGVGAEACLWAWSHNDNQILAVRIACIMQQLHNLRPLTSAAQSSLSTLLIKSPGEC